MKTQTLKKGKFSVNILRKQYNLYSKALLRFLLTNQNHRKNLKFHSMRKIKQISSFLLLHNFHLELFF